MGEEKKEFQYENSVGNLDCNENVDDEVRSENKFSSTLYLIPNKAIPVFITKAFSNLPLNGLHESSLKKQVPND